MATVLLAASASLATPATASASPDPLYFPIALRPVSRHLNVTDSIGGAASSMAIAGDVAFTATGGRLQAYRLAPGEDLARLPMNVELQRPVRSVAVHEGHLYAAIQGTPGVAIYAIERGPDLLPAGAVDQVTDAVDMSFVGDRAYLCDERGVRVLDATRPSAPSLLGGVDITGGAYGCDATNGGVVVARRARALGLSFVDATDPARTSLAAQLPAATGFDSYPQHVVRGSYAYVARVDRGGSGGGPTILEVYDVSEPRAPRLVGAATVAHTWVAAAATMAIDGGELYLAGDRELVAMDVSDETAPRWLSRASLRAPAGAAAVVDGSRLAVAGAGITVFDIGDPERPTIERSLTEVDVTHVVASAGGKAYVSQPGVSEISIVEATDDGRASPVGAIELQGGTAVRGVAPHGERLYVARAKDVLAFDVSDPSSPLALPVPYEVPISPGRSSWLVHSAAVSLDGSHLYVVRLRWNSILLDAVDVRDPNAVLPAGSLDVHDDPWLDRTKGDIVATDGYVVVTYQEYPLNAQRWNFPWRMAVIQAAGPSGLRKVADIEVPCGYGAVARGRQVILYGCGETRAFELDDAGTPTELGALEGLDEFVHAAWDGGTLLGITRFGRLHRIDVSEPRAMRWVSELAVPETGRYLAASRGWAWLSAGGAGLLLVR